ncbi:hotdog domain-containing protein [Phaeovulum sp. W22_SRMD_FR3]|uniref:hotdog domain-containing protein n=1 Tax=Phaeovulum sp. W22_SRMD_FR3 TaxID=3240274 RepID=UPI003F95EA1A
MADTPAPQALPTAPQGDLVLRTAAPFDQVTPKGAVTGAWILGALDTAAGIAGRRVSGGDALILSLQEARFHAPLTPGTAVDMTAEILRKGNTSFTLQFTLWAEPDTAPKRILTAQVVMVAVDAEGKPRKLAA